MRSPQFPFTVTENGVSARIRKASQTKNGKPYTLFVVDYCLLGQRKREMAAKDEAKTFVRDRIKPTFDNCQPVSDQMISAESYEFTFGAMPFYFTGAGSPSKLQSKPIRWLFLDEVQNYPKGALTNEGLVLTFDETISSIPPTGTQGPPGPDNLYFWQAGILTKRRVIKFRGHGWGYGLAALTLAPLGARYLAGSGRRSGRSMFQ